ncbi:hypothetical protein D3C87_1689490 [compost metagenome]
MVIGICGAKVIACSIAVGLAWGLSSSGDGAAVAFIERTTSPGAASLPNSDLANVD